MVNSVSSVQYGPKTRFTKKGNAYQKTNAITWAGVGAGTALGLAKNVNTILNFKSITEQVKNCMPELELQIKSMLCNILPQDGSTDELFKSAQFKKLVNNAPKIGVAATVALCIIVPAVAGLIIGGIGNFITNKVRAHKADKNASENQNNQPISKQPQPLQQSKTMLNIKPPF